MDWIKAFSRDYLYTELTIFELGAITKLKCLTAHLERIPTEKEMTKHVPKRSLDKLRSKLEDLSEPLGACLERCCEDARHYAQVASNARTRNKKSYTKGKNHEIHTGQIREDKIREEEIREDKKGGVPPGPPSTSFFSPPTKANVTAFCQDNFLDVHPFEFFDYYDQRNWKDKNGRELTDWKITAQSWHARKKKGWVTNV
jgi:hypothetical protein